MTEHTDEIDETVPEPTHTIQAGDTVIHEDAPYFMYGNVYSVQDGKASVEWPDMDVHDGIPVERLRFVDRPEAYVCVSYHGVDELDHAAKSYRFMRIADSGDITDQIVDDIAFYGKTAGYTIVDSYVPTSPDQDDGSAC